jgi:hypothetical protein
MNRRERRFMERMSQKEFKRVRDYTLKQLKEQFPNQNFTKEDLKGIDEQVKNIIEIEKNNPSNV